MEVILGAKLIAEGVQDDLFPFKARLEKLKAKKRCSRFFVPA